MHMVVNMCILGLLTYAGEHQYMKSGQLHYGSNQDTDQCTESGQLKGNLLGLESC